ncbi:MAG: hypothetical protein IJF83_11765 [Methanobrevibacter sp.]|nr:hypothetical protein [Methanobrevibacter sp.]
MKYKYLGLAVLIILCLVIIPISFASPVDSDNLSNSSYVAENYPSVSLAENSYYGENNHSIEEPMLDDDFAGTKITITNRNTFYVNASYSGASELGTIDNPFKDINSAFSSLSVNRSIVNIYIAEGSYTVSKTVDINKNLNIVGVNPLNTVISGSDRTGIFNVNKNNLVINIINLTFTQGNTYYGGAIYNNRSSVRLVNDIFRDNYAFGYTSKLQNYSAAGGALYNDGGTFKIYNSTFINNHAKSSLNVYAGAIYSEFGSISILNSKFINNEVDDADYGSGGAIYNFNGFLTVSNCVFSNNMIKSNYSIGGAIYSYEGKNVYVINSTFDGNEIYGKYTFGSAIANSAVLLDVVNSSFSNHLANGIAPKNTTIFNINGYYNFINSSMANNTIKDSRENILICLEDQFVISDAFDDELLQNLPSKYDLRNSGDVTYAKNQGSSGACWAFSTLAALESFLIKTENVSYDLSENNLKNVMNYRGVNGTDWPDGGNYQMALAYLLRWDGPVDENDDPFSAYSIIPNYDVSPMKHVQGAMFLPIRMGYLDNNQIKYAVMKYGALYASIYGTSMIKNVYNSAAQIPNHAVAIVGWDDNYAASKFLGTKPPGNGAWIIKNSWGTSYGDKGFGYVSYYDKTFAGFALDSLSALAFTNVENVTNYKDIYQYDLLGNTYESLGFGSNVAYLANQFEAVSDNPLSAFGFYAYGMSDYDADIYVNGELKYSQKGNVSYAGYHTIKLNQLVDLTKGDIFRINLKLNTYDSIFPIAIESARNGYSSKANASLNQSFVSPDGVNWYDIGQDFDIIKISGCFYNKTLERANVCLKAYTANCGNLKLNLTSSPSLFYKGDEITLSFDLYNVGDYVKGVNLSFNLDEICEMMAVNLTKGNFKDNVWIIDELANNESATLNLTVKMLENKDWAFNSVVIKSSDVVKNNHEVINFNMSYAGFTKFLVENMTSLSKSGETVNITLIDGLSKPVANAKVLVCWGGENITLASDGNGSIKLKLDLLEGSYLYNIYFVGDSIYHPTNASFNVNICKRPSKLVNTNQTVFYYSEDILVFLADGDGKALADRYVIFNGTNIGISDSNGVAKLPYNLKSGNYTIESLFEGDDLYYSSNCTFNISIIKKDTLLSSNTINTYAVVLNSDKNSAPYLKVYLKDSNNTALTNKSIQIKLASKTYNLHTDENGVAKLQIDIAKSGTYVAQIKFWGDDEYNGLAISSKVVIKKKKVSMTVPAKTYKKAAKAKKLTVTLRDSKGKAISNKMVYFKVNGKTYSAKTNKNGLASVNVKITKKKTYKVNVNFKGDSSYNKISKTSKVIIK